MNANDLVSKMVETQQVTFSFGKNGWGLSDEFISIGNRIKELSKHNNVYLKDAIIDTLDDVYDLTFEIHPHSDSTINPVSKLDEKLDESFGAWNGLSNGKIGGLSEDRYE